ncbi:MAG: selenium-dependent molybdenum cofactor biosynthesis protein YqeB [Desulfobacter sp.]
MTIPRDNRTATDMSIPLTNLVIAFKSAGEMATGIASRLFNSNLGRIFMMETESPLAVRRKVSFCEAVYDGACVVEDITARRVENPGQIPSAWDAREVPVIVDPAWHALKTLRPHVVIDAIIAKKNLGTSMDEALLTIGLGPGFRAGSDVHVVVETNRGHNLGRVIYQGEAQPNTGIPGTIGNISYDRVLRAPCQGRFTPTVAIGQLVESGQVLAHVGTAPVTARTGGMVRGLIRSGTRVTPGLKVGDIDPRGEGAFCDRISEKARALGGAVLEAILHRFNT